jgi:hypothetical protein
MVIIQVWHNILAGIKIANIGSLHRTIPAGLPIKNWSDEIERTAFGK